MSFTPFLTFDGTAEAAMRFYAEVFGAELTVMRFSEAPPAEGLPPSNRVMYSHIMLGEACLMASDVPAGMACPPQASVSVNHAVPDFETGAALFARLAEGGSVTMAFGPTFWSPGFGICVDRFGTSWMIGVPMPQEAA